MSRSNFDKPFYVDVGTSVAVIRCASNHDVIAEMYHHGQKDVIKIIEDKCARMNQEAKQFYAPTGNAAAMREALMKCLNYLTGETELVEDEIIALCDVMKAALAAPPRNCDVGTLEEQEECFERYCESNYNHNDVDAECWGCPLSKHRNTCEFAWAQMPYEAGEEGAE